MNKVQVCNSWLKNSKNTIIILLFYDIYVHNALECNSSLGYSISF
jgi:hypothetical protein